MSTFIAAPLKPHEQASKGIYGSFEMDPVVKLIVEARVLFLFKEPNIGNLLTLLTLVEVDDDICVETDGKSLFYNRENVKSATQNELMDRMRVLAQFVDVEAQ